jgi:hypothetical protein
VKHKRAFTALVGIAIGGTVAAIIHQLRKPVTYNLRDSSGKVAATGTAKDGKVTVDGTLPYGTYTIREEDPATTE